MKIAILTTYFHPEENGLTRYIEGLYSALLKNHPEIEVEVIAFDTLKTGKADEKWGKFKIHRVKSWQFMGRTYAIPTPGGYLQIKKIFAENQYDSINTHTRFFFSSFLGIWFGKKYSIPVVHTEHGSGFVQNGNFWVELIAKIYDYTLGKYTLKNSAIVCGVSQSVCAFAKRLGAKEAHTIYNGIETDFWKKNLNADNIRKEMGVSEEEKVFTFVGRLVPSKGCQDILEALREVKAFRWKLFVVGDGAYRKNLEALIVKNNFGGRVVFLGMCKKEKIRAVLQITDLFINASFASEGLPTTILEAAATGARCVSSDMGGSVEIVGEENVYPARDITTLRGKIANYEKIKKTDITRFDWDNIAEKYFAVLNLM